MQGRAEANEADGMQIEAVTTAVGPASAWLWPLRDKQARGGG